MQQVYLGEIIKFRIAYSNSDGNLIDPPEVTFSAYRTIGVPTFGPLQHNGGDGDVERLGEGHYEVTLLVHPQMMPGIYTAQWEALLPDALSVGSAVEVEGHDTFAYSEGELAPESAEVEGGTAKFSRVEFQIAERLPELSGPLDPPITHGYMGASPRFSDMGFGATSQLCIVGHCSGLTLNEPHQIHNMQETLNIIGANRYSPMVHYILEAHHAGCRDIWIMPSAPEYEYVHWDPSAPETRLVPRPELGGRSFYEQYKIRYEESMSALAEWEFPDIIVAPDAPLYNTGGVDFLAPLAQSCTDGFTETGRFRFGYIGTLIGNTFTEEDFNAIVNDPRLDDYDTGGKAVFVVHGEGTVKIPNMDSPYAHSVVNAIAATATTLRPERGLAYVPIPGVINPTRGDMSKEQIKEMSRAKVNPFIRTPRAKRGAAYESVLATDNLLAMDGSDYWALPQMKLVQEVIKRVRALAGVRLGTINFREFRDSVYTYLNYLVLDNRIRDYDAAVDRSMADFNSVTVSINLTPYTGIRQIYFSVEVGAGQVVNNANRNTV